MTYYLLQPNSEKLTNLKNAIYPNVAPWGLNGLVCWVWPNPPLFGDEKPVFWFCAMLPKLGELLWAARDANAVDGCWAAAPKPKLPAKIQ